MNFSEKRMTSSFYKSETKKDRAIESPTIRAFWKVCFSKSFVITHFKRSMDCRSRLKFYRSRNTLFDLDFLISRKFEQLSNFNFSEKRMASSFYRS